MAQRIQTLFIDDIDGGAAEGTVRFALDGTDYEIDLSGKHSDELRDALRKYVEHARKVGGAARRRAPAAVVRRARWTRWLFAPGRGRTGTTSRTAAACRLSSSRSTRRRPEPDQASERRLDWLILPARAAVWHGQLAAAAGAFADAAIRENLRAVGLTVAALAALIAKSYVR